ncbi:unnamed protein product [Closterium sp. NIES-64]|nr:unnamed protein product [Closterium sp. NIES-64]
MSQSRPPNVRREEAEENGNEEEGIERQGRGRVESEDVAAEEDHQGNLQTGWAAHRQEAQEVPQPQPVGREEVEEPMASTAPTQQARMIAAGTTGEMLTDNAAALAPRGGDCASDTGARQSLAGQREGAEADGDVGRSRHEPGDVDGSARGESDRLARDDEGRSRPPRARPGQRRLGAGLAPARPGPVSGWDQQENQPSGPTERRIDACQSSPRGLQAQGGEGEENRVAEHLEENEYREEEGIATPGTEEPSPGADKEQTAEVVLSASPAPVTAAVLAAAMSAATGEQGRAPLAEDVMTAAACAETPVDAVAANRQECA